MRLPLSILGITGKMGRRLLALAARDENVHLVGGCAHSSHTNEPDLQALLCSTPEQALASCQVAIDFSSPYATQRHVEAARAAHKGLVIGTTGLSSEDLACIQAAAREIPIVLSPNFSVGVALCLQAIATLSQQLGQVHIDITETHHLHKKDKPSGTALAFAQATQQEHIPIHSIRTGEVVGEHLIRFQWGEESIELKHTAHSRDVFALGALQAAKRLVHQPPGLYSLKDLYRETVS